MPASSWYSYAGHADRSALPIYINLLLRLSGYLTHSLGELEVYVPMCSRSEQRADDGARVYATYSR